MRVNPAMLASTVFVFLTACTAVENQRGYVPDAEVLGSLAVGQDTKATVAQKLGNPTVAGTFNNDTWYYISSHDVQTAFFATHSVRRNIVAVEFSNTGQIASVKRYGLEDGSIIDYVTRETPTRGRELSLLQQIFNAVPGNVGQAAPNQETNPGGGGGPPPF